MPGKDKSRSGCWVGRRIAQQQQGWQGWRLDGSKNETLTLVQQGRVYPQEQLEVHADFEFICTDIDHLAGITTQEQRIARLLLGARVFSTSWTHAVWMREAAGHVRQRLYLA